MPRWTQALLSSYFTCVFCAREVEAQWRPQPSSYLATVSPRSALGSESSAWYPTEQGVFGPVPY